MWKGHISASRSFRHAIYRRCFIFKLSVWVSGSCASFSTAPLYLRADSNFIVLLSVNAPIYCRGR
jgi:hypothetical protein